jgi:hypothetical protein
MPEAAAEIAAGLEFHARLRCGRHLLFEHNRIAVDRGFAVVACDDACLPASAAGRHVAGFRARHLQAAAAGS